MCQSKAQGGQRCASHTRENFKKASMGLIEARKNGSPEDRETAQDRWDAAAVEYASTEEGQQAMSRFQAAAEERGKVHEAENYAYIKRQGDRLRHINATVRAQMRPKLKGIPRGQVNFKRHLWKQAEEKGFTREQIYEAIETPYKITDVSAHEGQQRYCGAGVAVVMDGNSAITVYADGIRTALRPDQMNDPAALASKRALR